QKVIERAFSHSEIFEISRGFVDCAEEKWETIVGQAMDRGHELALRIEGQFAHSRQGGIQLRFGNARFAGRNQQGYLCRVTQCAARVLLALFLSRGGIIAKCSGGKQEQQWRLVDSRR